MKNAPAVLGEVAGNFSCYYTASTARKIPATFLQREACLMAMNDARSALIKASLAWLQQGVSKFYSW
ncbi:hypothetical protein [Nitrosovibrio sp. Nv6]|uniref:hypothetical protein n=1 Tax=Nitrosovibrio sp. Nv6 TaxID=1855340 RepID=UPI0011C380D2|nr:hypothetical protein [Nitrosovibrio sp. Nv6]